MSRVRASGRIALFSCLLLCCAAEARADYLITPFIGSIFAGDTTLLDLDIGAATSKHWAFGGNAAWLSDEIFGVEADFAMVPGFFQRSGAPQLVLGSRVTTLTGNIIAALPLSVTRESLRPYVTGGLGLIHAAAKDLIGLNESNNLLGLQLGGGAIGMITNRAGIRFDLRHARTFSRDNTLRGDRISKLSFWRASVGVTLRY